MAELRKRNPKSYDAEANRSRELGQKQIQAMESISKAEKRMIGCLAVLCVAFVLFNVWWWTQPAEPKKWVYRSPRERDGLE